MSKRQIFLADGTHIERNAKLNSYKANSREVYLERIAVLEEDNATVIGYLMILLSVLSALSVVYDIVIHFNVKSEYAAVMNDRGTNEY